MLIKVPFLIKFLLFCCIMLGWMFLFITFKNLKVCFLKLLLCKDHCQMAASIIYFLKVKMILMPWCLRKLGLKVTQFIEEGGSLLLPYSVLFYSHVWRLLFSSIILSQRWWCHIQYKLLVYCCSFFSINWLWTGT